jgi:hypothetical protein
MREGGKHRKKGTTKIQKLLDIGTTFKGLLPSSSQISQMKQQPQNSRTYSVDIGSLVRCTFQKKMRQSWERFEDVEGLGKLL